MLAARPRVQLCCCCILAVLLAIICPLSMQRVQAQESGGSSALTGSSIINALEMVQDSVALGSQGPTDTAASVVAATITPQTDADTAVMRADKPRQRTASKAKRMAARLQMAELAAAENTRPATAAAADVADVANAPGVQPATASEAPAVPQRAASDVPDVPIYAMAINTMYQAIFDKHNSYRATHQAGGLTWSDTLASQATSYAAQCNFAHDPNANAGENLFATSDTSNSSGALTQAIDYWYDEVRMYSFSNPGFSSSTGHFTQVVWRATTAVGCAVQTCNNGMGGTGWAKGTLVVCRYSPAGNVLGQFQQNVLPATTNPPPPPASPSPPSSPRPSSPIPSSPRPSSPLPSSPRPSTPSASSPRPSSPPPSSPPPTQIPAGTLPAGYKFVNPGCLYSPNQQTRLCMQDTGFVVLYRGGNPGSAVWVSPNTSISWFKPYKLTMLTDGNLVASDNINRVLWQSGTARKGVAPRRLVVQDDGNVVIIDATNTKTWATNTAAGRR